MASDNPVYAARSRLANLCRSGADPEVIAAARQDLTLAKAERLRRDADALEAGVRRGELLITGQAQPLVEKPAPEFHRALETFQAEDSQRFRKEHGHPYNWDDDDREAWDELLRRHTALHVALGCHMNAPCLSARGAGSVKA